MATKTEQQAVRQASCLHSVKTVLGVKVRGGVPKFDVKCVFCKAVLKGLSEQEARS